MKEVERTIHLYRKVDVNESMEERHKKVMEGLSKLGAPLGLKDSEIPEIPDFGTELVCFYDAKNIKTKGVSIEGVYRWRGLKYVVWDELRYEFKITYKLINYKKIIYEDLPKVINIFDPYVADIFVSSSYSIAYKESYKSEILKLKEKGLKELQDVLFTLSPVMYFNEESYNKLIKVPKEELLERLKGKANEVQLLEKGIYIIFNDKADITYKEFVEMNNIFKPLLRLI
ncbi:helicase [Leptotrichia sp. oral taxon 218]|uniref:helicase n=1 Tax=Leptotrichia sp. oral taxon 218 TaxID=712361 RepID=UPI001B8BF8EE|nr:helicase [Leptotrichia sp. oral taxon 218]QUB96084.1 helicase [Leptotrichia sp. oral taxon 218]